MMLKKLLGVDKKLPNVYFDERAKPLEGKNMLMINGSQRRRSAGFLHSIVTYVISTILAIFFLLLLLAILFDVNVCVTCLASYPEVIKNKMNDQGQIISNYDHNIERDLSENTSNVNIMTTERAIPSTETTLKNLEMNRAEINVLVDTPPEKMSTHQNNESVTNSMKHIPHNKYPYHEKVSEGETTTKGSINIHMHGKNDKNIAKEHSGNFSDLGIKTTSGTVPKTETSHLMNLKELSKDYQKLEIDRPLILLLQSMLYSGIEHKNHETNTYTVMNNMHNVNQNHEKVSEVDIPKKTTFNANKNNSNPIIMTDIHQIIRHTPFKLKTHFQKSSKAFKNDDEDTEIPNANENFPGKSDEMDHYAVLEEKNAESERPISIGKLQQLPYLSNNLKNYSPLNADSKIVIRIMSNPKKNEGSYKTTVEQDINEIKPYSEKTASVLIDPIIQPSYTNKDGLSAHTLMRHTLRIYPLKLLAMKNTPVIKDVHEDFSFKHFPDFSNDRIFLPLSKTKFGRKVLKESHSSLINQKTANEFIIQRSFLNDDELSSHSLMRNSHQMYPLERPAIKNASPINYEYEDVPSKFIPEFQNDRRFLSKNKLDRQLLKEKEKIEVDYSLELTSPTTPIFLNELNNSSQIDSNATEAISDHISSYLIALTDPIKAETIENTEYLHLNNDTEITNRDINLKFFHAPIDKTLNNSSSISIYENKYSKPTETLLRDFPKGHNFNEFLQRHESTTIDKGSRKPFSLNKYHNEEQSETYKLLPKAPKKSKMKLLSKFQKNLLPTVLIAEKSLEREDDNFNPFDRSTKGMLVDNSKYYPIMKFSSTLDPESIPYDKHFA